MDDELLLRLAEQIEAENDLSDAKSRLGSGSPPDMSFLQANRAALLQLAALAIRAATQSPEVRIGERTVLVEEITQLRLEPGDRIIAGLSRDENLPSESPEVASHARPHLRDRLILLGGGVVLALLVVVFIVGILSIAELFS